MASVRPPAWFPPMLVSLKHKVAFAHYPKTAGSSIGTWFMESCPDASYLVPSNPHLPVSESLRVLRRRFRSTPAGALREARAGALRLLSLRLGPVPWTDPEWRVFGVLRDPFEMLVSLYEFWRAQPGDDPCTSPASRLFNCARRNGFREFVSASLIGGAVPRYEEFFDAGGPLWSRTTLLRFSSVDRDLPHFCACAGLPTPARLHRLNSSPAGGRDLRRYAHEIGGLMDDLQRHFRWYYEWTQPEPVQRPLA